MNMTINDAVSKTGSGYGMRKSLFDNDKVYLNRRLANYKQELVRTKNLKEECDG
ncbi:MAG: hypothetical protein Nk1A_8210 [Endomicrobiia bacterium]|nr:MAG: hypothetical protein Nk1A_8210 [Endomicrobiia bacterium]